jgi:serine/threonine protein kinase
MHVLLEIPAAIKVLHTYWTDVGKEGFLTEAERLVRLNHPNSVRVLEFGFQGDTSHLVMEYAPNGLLKDHHAATSVFPIASAGKYHHPPYTLLTEDFTNER